MKRTLKLLLSLGLVTMAGDAPGLDLAKAALPGANGPILFSRDVARGEGFNYEIFRARNDGTRAKRLTFSKAWDRNPAWSPNGSRIIFHRAIRDTSGIWIMKADGSNKRPIDAARFGGNPAWSPDGKSIAFSKGPGVYTLDLTDSNAEAVSVVEYTDGGEATFWGVAWSPNGERIAYAVERDTESYVGVVDADEGNDERWELSYFISGIDWSPSGKRLVTAMYDARPRDEKEVSGWEIYTLAPGAADPPKSVRRITMNGYNDEKNRGEENEPVWSPNGKKIMFSNDFGRRDDELVTVNADFRKKPRPRVLTNNKIDEASPSWLAGP